MPSVASTTRSRPGCVVPSFAPAGAPTSFGKLVLFVIWLGCFFWISRFVARVSVTHFLRQVLPKVMLLHLSPSQLCLRLTLFWYHFLFVLFRACSTLLHFFFTFFHLFPRSFCFLLLFVPLHLLPVHLGHVFPQLLNAYLSLIPTDFLSCSCLHTC